MEINQYAVHWIDFDPAKGGEVKKPRPCVIVSPNEMNRFLKTVIIAPLTHTIKAYPSRLRCNIENQVGSIMLDQIRTVDKVRIGNVLGQLSLAEINEVKYILNQMLC